MQITNNVAYQTLQNVKQNLQILEDAIEKYDGTDVSVFLPLAYNVRNILNGAFSTAFGLGA